MSPACPSPDPIGPAALQAAGFATVEVLAETESTMVRARELAAAAACPFPAAVIADRQTLGRGRRGARWWQPPGSLAVSIVLAADAGVPPPAWSLACGVALAETLRAVAPAVQAVVRWPNDIEVAGRKLAGILVETVAGGRTIFGIGVNTTGSAQDAPAALVHRVTTLPDLVGAALPRERLLVAFLPRLRRLLGELTADPALLPDRYRPLCALEGTPVTIHVGAERQHGICRGIAADGALVLDTAAGRMRFASGSLTDPAAVWHGDD
jgi:BirA family biotin operon repressor/biotin-[acetyl-CoA-carboxylase] ligase